MSRFERALIVIKFVRSVLQSPGFALQAAEIKQISELPIKPWLQKILTFILATSRESRRRPTGYENVPHNAASEAGVPRPLWEKFPADPDYYTDPWPKRIAERKEIMKQRLAEEAAVLQNLGLPVPAQCHDVLTTARSHFYPWMSYREKEGAHWICMIDYTWPTFILPPHLFLICDRKEADKAETKFLMALEGGVGNTTKKEDFPLNAGVCSPYYCVTGDAPTVERASQVLSEQGPAAVVEQFPGIWTNRDPFLLYRITNHPRFINLMSFTYEKVDGKDNYDQVKEVKWSWPVLETVEGYTPAQLHSREFHMQILRQVAQGLEKISMGAPHPDCYLTQAPHKVEFQYAASAPPLRPLTAPAEQVTLKILPTGDVVKSAVAEEFIQSLRAARSAVTFALESTADAHCFTISCAEEDRPLVEQQLQNFFPAFAVIEEPPSPATPAHVITATLRNQSRVLKTQFAIDPYRLLFNSLEAADGGEFRLEILFAPIAPDVGTYLTKWFEGKKKEVENSYNKDKEKELVVERLKQWQKKQPEWKVAIRVTANEQHNLTQVIKGFLRQFDTVGDFWELYEPGEYAPLPFSLMSTAELAALAHFPGKDVQSERLETVSMKTKLPPQLYAESAPTAIAIGQATHRKQTVTVTLPEQVRDRHIYIVGKSGMGKSTLITNMASQDIQAGRGVAVIDPHGDLVDDLLPYIPPERVADTILFNPADKAHPVTLSPLACSDEDEYERVVSDLVTTMSRLTESWGHQIEYLFRAIFNTLVRVPGATFIDVHDIIASEKRREELLRQVSHPRTLNFWYEQFDSLLPKNARLPILTRMERIVDSPTLSRILGSSESRLNFTDVIENKKIFLARLSKGEIGEDSVKLLGSILTSQIQLAIMRRARISKEQRTPFYLYVDEFQNFTTPTFETILSEARKYQLSLTFAHQFISQLSDQMRSAILGNVSTVMMFNLDIADARKLEGQLGSYTQDDVAQLPKHHLFCRPATSSQDTFPMETLAPLPRHAVNSSRAIIEHTREIYSATAPAELPPEPVKQTPEMPHVEVKPPAPPPAQVPIRTTQPGAQVRLMKAEPPDGLSTKEKILFYVQQAEYLATPHLITLCFGNYSTEASKRANASAILKDLIEGKQLRMQPFGRGNVYFTGRTPNPTAHNLAVRDLFVKLNTSGYAFGDVQFAYEQIPGCVPDLYVEFSGEAGEVVTTFWEYDTGTEGMAEIERKLRRYGATGYDRLVFVVTNDARRQQLLRTINQPGVYVTVLDEMTGLAEPVFWVPGQSAPQPLFEP